MASEKQKEVQGAAAPQQASPGPWERTNLVGGKLQIEARVGIGRYGCAVADVRHPETERGAANALLITAAPDLADALEALIRLYGPEGDFALNAVTVHEQARAALRLAGRLP